MSVPRSKSDLLDAISKTFDRLVQDLARVPVDVAREKSLEGHAAGTLMSPADLVAYLIGWNELVLKWLEHDDRGEPVDFPEDGYKWSQLGALAQKFYDHYRDLDWPELLDRLQGAKAGLVATIIERSDEELYGQPWYDKWTKGRMIQFNPSSPYANARRRIRAWLREKAYLSK
ncbi:MAG: hypothetical protein CML29_16345 [Rhizobiales bacterium]|nr:hypothetical protein [Hyphomicrobiales bacterium]